MRGLAGSTPRSAARQSCQYPSATAITPKQASKTTAVRRRLALRSSSTGLLVRNAQQQSDDDEVGDHRAAAVADEGQGDASQGDQLERAGQDDQRLQRDD